MDEKYAIDYSILNTPAADIYLDKVNIYWMSFVVVGESDCVCMFCVCEFGVL